MPLYRYEWEVILAGEGRNPDEAWEYAVDCVAADGLGSADAPILREVVDPEEVGPVDDTEIVKRPEDQLWLIWSVEHSAWWKPAQIGYTIKLSEAGRYAFQTAVNICRVAGFRRSNFSHQDIKTPNETMFLAEDL